MTQSNSFPSGARPTILGDVLAAITPVDPSAIAAHQRHIDSLTKPLGSLGQLEPIAARFAAIRGTRVELPLRKAIYVFAADHGVVEEGVSAYPQAVTAQMVLNFLQGGAAINVLCRAHNVTLSVVDVGVCTDFEPSPVLLQQKVCHGTRNMFREPALSIDELHQALEVGFTLAEQAAHSGVALLAAGEMGIGNTTAASAITSAITGAPVAQVTGAGTGLVTEAVTKKIAVIEASLQRHFPGRDATPPAPLDIMRCVGGAEIAAITGLILRAASLHIPFLLDGFIVTAAATIAVALQPHVRDYLFAGHQSQEPGHRIQLAHLGLQPLLSLGMRLGEGTGAVLAMPLVESALQLSASMATFTSAGVATAIE